jgi:hypothetical protein
MGLEAIFSFGMSVSVVSALAALSVFVLAANLFGLHTASSEILSVIESLETPFDLGGAMQKYGAGRSDFYTPHLKSAWDNAIKAKEKARNMYSKSMSASFSSGSKNKMSELIVDFAMYSDEKEAKALFDAAVKSSYLAFRSMIGLIEHDAADLDSLGADNLNYTGAAGQRYRAARDLVTTLTAYGSTSEDEFQKYEVGCYDVGSLSNLNIKQLSMCALRRIQSDNGDDAHFSAETFNFILGYSRNSLLKYYSALHQNLTDAAAEMEEEHDAADRLFDDNNEILSEAASELKDEEAALVENRHVNTINSALTDGLEIAASASGSPSEQFRRITDFSSRAGSIKSTAERVYSAKADDWLFLSTKQLGEGAAQLSEFISMAETLSSGMTQLRQKGQEAFEKLLAETDDEFYSGVFYSHALQLKQEALQARTDGKAIVAWADAIEYLRVVRGHDDGSDVLFRIGEIIKELKALGYDVSAEELTYEGLKNRAKIVDELPRVVPIAQDLWNKLDVIAEPVLKEIERSRQEAGALLSTAEAFMSAGISLDTRAVSQHSQKYEDSLSLEPSLHMSELLGTYRGIINYLKPVLDSAAGKYLSLNAVLKTYFEETPVCDEWVSAQMLFEVTNDAPVAFENIVVSKKLDLPITNASGFVSGGVVSFPIDLILPEETKAANFTALVLPLRCPEPNASVHEEEVKTEKKTATVERSNVSVYSTKAGQNETYTKAAATAQVQYEKLKLELKSQILRVCLFADCNELLDRYEKCGDDCDSLAPDVEEAAASVLNGFAAYGETLDSLTESLADLKRAVDTTVSVNYSLDLVYTESDYNRAKDEQKRLKTVGKLVDSLLVSTDNSTDKLERMMKSFSPRDLQKYGDDIVSLANLINDSISALEQSASSAVGAAKNQSSGDLLFKAQQAYNEGYYNRAIIYASGASGSAVESLKKQGGGLPLHYFAMAALLCGFTVFILKKPKPKPLPPRQIF